MIAAALRAMVARRRPAYVVAPYGYSRPVRHCASSWQDALEWARCYPAGDPDPLILDRDGRPVRYVR